MNTNTPNSIETKGLLADGNCNWLACNHLTVDQVDRPIIIVNPLLLCPDCAREFGCRLGVVAYDAIQRENEGSGFTFDLNEVSEEELKAILDSGAVPLEKGEYKVCGCFHKENDPFGPVYTNRMATLTIGTLCCGNCSINSDLIPVRQEEFERILATKFMQANWSSFKNIL